MYSIGSDLDLIPFKYEFEPNFSNYKLIEENPENDNIIYYDEENKRFIKFLYPSKAPDRYLQLKREIIIGEFLHEMYPQNFINIIGYINFDCIKATRKYGKKAICEGLVSEKIEGIHFEEFLATTTPNLFKEFILKLFRFLLQVNEEYLFSHNDLHTGNVFVGPDLEPILLDFGQSFIEIPVREFCSEYPENNLCQVFKNLPDTLIISNYYTKSRENTSFLSPIRDFELLLKMTQDFFVDRWQYKIVFNDLYKELFSVSKKEKKIIFESEKQYQEFRDLIYAENLKEFLYYTEKYKDVINELDQLKQTNYEEQIETYLTTNLKQEEYWERINVFCSNILDFISATDDLIYLTEKDYYLEYDQFLRMDEDYQELKKLGKIKRVGLENLLEDIKNLTI